MATIYPAPGSGGGGGGGEGTVASDDVPDAITTMFSIG
jgi:hypothetical protein